MGRLGGVFMEPSTPTSSSYSGEGEATAWFKHQRLSQDYVELLKGTEAKRKQLLIAKQKKPKLLAEVKFLRRKLRCLTANRSPKAPYRLKKLSQNASPASILDDHQPSRVIRSKISADNNLSIRKEASITSTSSVIDLNRASLPDCAEMEEFQVNWEPLKVENLKKCSARSKTAVNDLNLNLSIYRDAESEANWVGKKKITLQDQLAIV